MEKFKFSLQLFGGMPGVEDDNPLVPDDEEISLKGLLGADEDEEEDEKEDGEHEPTDEDDEAITEAVAEKNEEVKEEEKPVETPPTEEPPKEKLFTQAEIDRIIGERLARDKKVQLVRELETEAGLDMEAIVTHVRNNRIQNTAEQMGVTEDEARKIIEAQEKSQKLEAELNEVKQKQELFTKNTVYAQDKAKQINNPLVKKYEKEIDAFSNQGALVDFNTAMRYVIGTKVMEGELLKDVKTATEQRVLRDVNTRSKTTSVSTGKATAGGVVTLTKEQQKYARILGLSDKEYGEEIVKMEKQKRKR